MLFKMFNSMPQQMGMAADLIVENLDFKDADRLARRLRKSLPPHLLEQREGEELGQAPPNPAMVAIQAKMQTEQSKVLMAQMKLQMEQIKTERERMKLQMEVAKIQMEIQKAQQAGDSGSHDKHMQRLMDAMELDRKHELEQQRLILEEAKLQHQITNDNKPYADN
jgi:tRNA threonylcarbamoyladenosine modification (KEOPS) complex  Pcc1 subunit